MQEEFWFVARMDDPVAASRRLARIVDIRPHGVELRGLVLPSGATPLHIASYNAYPAVVTVLIHQLAKEGADLDAVWQQGNVVHESIGFTAVQTCIYNATAEAAMAAIRALVAAGGDVNAWSPHAPALLVAACGRAATIKELLAAGADVQATDAHGCTTLHWAVFSHNVYAEGKQVTLHLLAAGLDPLAANNVGKTPLQWALVAEDTDTAAFLCRREHIATVQVSVALVVLAAPGLASMNEARHRCSSLANRLPQE
jgi:ankyrin repeat protein